MSAPASADLGSGAPGTTITGKLGSVTVTDNRSLLVATWAATASASNWTTGGGTPAETIPATDVGYTPGSLTATTGIGIFSPTTITLSGAPQEVMALTAGVGNNSASWNPTLSVAVPSSAASGTYTATLTESVS